MVRRQRSSVVNHELKLLSHWLRSNELSLNETKTELITFRSLGKNLPRESDIRINNNKLKLHSHIKYLAILIDKVLCWSKQIESICMKLARANGILSKLRYFLPISVSQYIISYFILILFTVVWFGPILEKAILIV